MPKIKLDKVKPGNKFTVNGEQYTVLKVPENYDVKYFSGTCSPPYCHDSEGNFTTWGNPERVDVEVDYHTYENLPIHTKFKFGNNYEYKTLVKLDDTRFASPDTSKKCSIGYLADTAYNKDSIVYEVN